MTPLAPKAPGFNHIVQSEDFPETQAAIAVAVQVLEEVGADPAIAALPEEVDVLHVADLAISIRVQCEEETPCQSLKVSRGIVVVSYSNLMKFFHCFLWGEPVITCESVTLSYQSTGFIEEFNNREINLLYWVVLKWNLSMTKPPSIKQNKKEKEFGSYPLSPSYQKIFMNYWTTNKNNTIFVIIHQATTYE